MADPQLTEWTDPGLSPAGPLPERRRPFLNNSGIFRISATPDVLRSPFGSRTPPPVASPKAFCNQAAIRRNAVS